MTACTRRLRRRSAVVFASILITFVAAGSARATTITFSEFPVGTVISNQYTPLGVTFTALGVGGGALPIIANDGAMPASPVLSPNPPFAGTFGFDFGPGAFGVMFDSGFWDSLSTAVVNVFDPSNNPLANLTNTGTGVFIFDLSALGTVGRVEFSSTADPAGGDIDNLSFTPVPEPFTLLLFGTGLAAVGLRRSRKRT